MESLTWPPAGSGRAHSAGPASPRAGLAQRTRRTWRRSPAEWAQLAPRGLYARHLREPLLLAAVLPLCLLALPLGVLVALLNARAHGVRRVFFAQLRVGWRGQPFVLYKFRTLSDAVGDDHARVTPFGRFLRNTHLDELPQLWNVLRRDMCLIGPRPEMLATERWAAAHVPGFSERLVLRPGLTGYAQITQGYTEFGDVRAYRRKQELNRHYRERLGPALDAALLLRTALWMLRGRGWRQRGVRGASARA